MKKYVLKKVINQIKTSRASPIYQTSGNRGMRIRFPHTRSPKRM